MPRFHEPACRARTRRAGASLFTVNTRTAWMNVSQDTVNVLFPSSEVPLAKNENQNSSTPTLSQCASPNVRKVALKIHTFKPAQAELDILHVTPTERCVSDGGANNLTVFYLQNHITRGAQAGHAQCTPSTHTKPRSLALQFLKAPHLLALAMNSFSRGPSICQNAAVCVTSVK